MKMVNKNKILYWTPRVLSILYILFLSLFALDVFNEYSGLAIVIPLLMHLIPSFILLIVVAISWKFEIVGAITFLGFALFYIYSIGPNRPWSWYTFISGPAAVVGILFLYNWLTINRFNKPKMKK